MFFNRLKPITLNFYTFDAAAHEYAKPSIGKTRPKWLSSLCPVIEHQRPDMPPGHIEKHPTAMYCPAIRDMINDSITLPAWYETDLIVSNGAWTDTKGPQWNEKIVMHTNDQVGDFYKDRLFLKMTSPWKGICTEDVNFLYLQNFYGSEFFDINDVIIPPGYTNFKYQHSTNVHLWIKNRPDTYTINVPIKTPLISLVPLTERKVIVKTHLVSYNDWYSLGSAYPKVSVGAYYKKLKMLRERN